MGGGKVARCVIHLQEGLCELPAGTHTLWRNSHTGSQCVGSAHLKLAAVLAAKLLATAQPSMARANEHASVVGHAPKRWALRPALLQGVAILYHEPGRLLCGGQAPRCRANIDGGQKLKYCVVLCTRNNGVCVRG